MGKSTISMAIFNSYVSLPEGNPPVSFSAHLGNPHPQQAAGGSSRPRSRWERSQKKAPPWAMTDGWWTPRGRREEKKWQHEMKPLV